MAYANVIAALTLAKDTAQKEMTAETDQQHLLKVNKHLTDAIQYLGFAGGITPDSDERPKLGPATSFGGEPIQRPAADVTQKEVSPEEEAKNILATKRDEAYAVFLNTDSKEILKTMEPMVIRAVGRKAGVEGITSTEPKEPFNVKFIDKIKAAITAQQADYTKRLEAAQADELTKREGLQALKDLNAPEAEIEAAQKLHDESLAVLNTLVGQKP